jgi:Glycosyl hydrolases family 25
MGLFIDISDNNAEPDYEALLLAGVEGIMLKATEGTTYVDPTFGARYDAAKKAGLTVGAYHFWHPETGNDDAQLNFFHEHYGESVDDYPPAWDSEINPSDLTWLELANRMAGIAWCLASWYGNAVWYYNRSWRGALRGLGPSPAAMPFNRGEWVAQGEGYPVGALLATAVQFAPVVGIPGTVGETDWNVTL